MILNNAPAVMLILIQVTGGLVLTGDPALIVYEDPCRTKKFNVVKLKLVQKYYGTNLDFDTLSEITSLFIDWRDTVEIIPMRMKYKQTKFIDLKGTPVGVDQWVNKYRSETGLFACSFNDDPRCSMAVYDAFRYQWVNKKSVKRGNDVYVSLLKEKFRPMIESSRNMDFFSTVVNDHRKRIRRTRMLYLTGTCDHAKTGDIVASWTSFGLMWNRFTTSLRDVFGKLAYIRTWQSQENGYPHFHALVYFNDFEFTAVYKSQDSSWRIHNRQQVVTDRKTGDKEPCIDVLVDRWKWGGLEVKCCDSSREALKDLLKYVLRDLEGGESDLTNAMVWYFQKKSFSVSKSFMALFGAFDEPSNADLINAEGVTQEVTQDDKLVAIDVFPLIPRDLMPFYSQLTIETCKDPPDLSPEMVNFLDNFADSCVPSISKINSDGVAITVFKFKEDGF